MANAKHTPKIFNATVTKGIVPDSDGDRYGSFNYGISPAPGLPSQAGFRFREDAQAAADKINAENYGYPIYEDSIFDAVFDDCLDYAPSHASQEPTITVWTDRNGINVAGLDGEIHMSDAEARKLVQKLLAVIDPNECELDGCK